jgi:glycosyltransferase involved in cell wall biosynthesis
MYFVQRLIAMPPIRWAILTGEYPPQSGGVADYTHMVCRALAAGGDQVHVLAPAIHSLSLVSRGEGGGEGPAFQLHKPCIADASAHGPSPRPSPLGTGAREKDEPGVFVHRLPGGFAPHALGQLSRLLTGIAPDRLLVQYVPDAFGLRAVNLPFCLWLLLCVRRPVWTMFHEVAYPWRGDRWKLNLLALLTRGMAGILLAASQRALVTIPAWRERLQPLNLARRPIDWLPVLSNLPADVDAQQVAALRQPLAGRPLLGHFSTFAPSVAKLLHDLLPGILRADTQRVFWLMGHNSDAFKEELLRCCPDVSPQIQATGPLAPAAAAQHVAACDLLVQPYPDGVSSRRSSLMSALALGTPVVTQAGAATEDFWHTSGAVALAPDTQQIAPLVDDLLEDPQRRAALSVRAKAFYAEHFAVEKTVAILHTEPPRRP